VQGAHSLQLKVEVNSLGNKCNLESQVISKQESWWGKATAPLSPKRCQAGVVRGWEGWSGAAHLLGEEMLAETRWTKEQGLKEHWHFR
jgi:hypothetical protein